MCVYNDAGDEMALKVFEVDEDHDTMELGTLREISILRILRGENAHPNIVQLIDIQEATEEGDCGVGNLSMAMPLYKMGDLKGAVKRGIIAPGLAGRRQRVEIAHGLLSAVAYLHDNHIIHRDIKSDNVMITMPGDDEEEKIVPVLIDFSLAKFIGGSNAILPPGATHTGDIGTPTYTAPEVVARKNYGLPSDLWSVGVVLLETLIGELSVDRDKAAARLIEEKKESLADSPFATLIRGLLDKDIDRRLTAREALALPVFEKFGLAIPPVRVVDIDSAFPTDEDAIANEESTVNNASANVLKPINGNKRMKTSKQQKVSPRDKLITKLCKELECKNPKTEMAAAVFAKKMEQVDDELDDIENTQTLLDCVVLACRFYEEELISLQELEEDDGGYFTSFKCFDIETYRDNETAIFSSMDYSLYLRN
jgi:serine/threonine protein kinase